MSDPSSEIDAGTACVHHLLRASIRSARLLAHYEQLLGCISRGQLDPAAVRDSMSRILRTGTTERIVKITGLTSRWFDDFLDRAMPSPDVGAASWLAAPLAASFPQIASPYFELLEALTDLYGDWADEILTGALALVRPKDLDAPFAVDLRAESGATASASILLANTRRERAVIRCAVTDVRRADGIGPAFVPALTIAPGRLQLEPGEEADVHLRLSLDAEVFDANAPYVGAVRVHRGGEPPFDVPLRILARDAS